MCKSEAHFSQKDHFSENSKILDGFISTALHKLPIFRILRYYIKTLNILKDIETCKYNLTFNNK